MPHLIVTGPESAGKTALARALAARLGGIAIPEYPRGYLEALGRRACAEDFAHFAAADGRLVRAAERQLARRARALDNGGAIVQDTGPEVLTVWYEDKFGRAPEFLTEAAHRSPADAYLLCRPDLPWEYDPLREDPHRRTELFARFSKLLAAYGKPVIEVTGTGEARLKSVLAALDELAIT